jgi:UDP:flavonoid glycosyltransferase YjiC (YdhE family)
MFGALLTKPMATDLLALARHWRPHLLVHEHGELASPLVGALLGTPSVTHSFGGAIPAPILAAGAAEVAPLWAAAGLEPPPYAGCFSSLYLDICPPSVQSVPTEHIPRSQPLRPVGEEAAAPAQVDQVPDGRPLVYLTLGTVQNRSPMLRPVVDAVAGLPVRLLVTVGPDGDPAMLGEQPAHVTVERWVDQGTVLPRCAVVVSHAGSGTFLGSLAAGRPQLCLPQAADQFRNAAGGVRAGAALALAPDEITAEAVRGAVSRLLREDAFRQGAEVVATEIAAMPSSVDVVDVLRGLTG